MDTATRQLEELLARKASAWVEILRNPTPAQRAEFVAWLKESPRNARDFLLMLALDAELDHLDSSRQVDIDALISSIDPRVAVVEPIGRRPRVETSPRQRPNRRWLRVAAAALAVGITTGGAWWLGATDSWQSYQTAVAEQRAFELADGSVVHLNTHSRVSIRLTRDSREVRLLSGEALFRVSHDPQRPFRVYTAEGVVQAVGTQFDVYERGQTTEVAVLEGRVTITSDAGRRDANPGMVRLVASNERATITRAGVVAVRSAVDVQDAVSWRERRLTFRDRTLAEIAAELNRYSHRRIMLKDEAIAGRRYSGVFDTDDLDSFAAVLARDGTLAVEATPDEITVRTRPDDQR